MSLTMYRENGSFFMTSEHRNQEIRGSRSNQWSNPFILCMVQSAATHNGHLRHIWWVINWTISIFAIMCQLTPNVQIRYHPVGCSRSNQASGIVDIHVNLRSTRLEEYWSCIRWVIALTSSKMQFLHPGTLKSNIRFYEIGRYKASHHLDIVWGALATRNAHLVGPGSNIQVAY